MRVAYPSLDDIAGKAGHYPTHLLEDADTGLCLFSAAFMGVNAEIHFALNGVDTTCVDVDAEKLEVMRVLYPDEWEFVCWDAWEFAAEAAAIGKRWDVVNVDTFRGNATERSLLDLGVWCAVANTAVVATIEEGQTCEIPNGWSAEYVRRNSNVLWLVLIRVVPA